MSNVVGFSPNADPWFVAKTGVANANDAMMAYFRGKSGLTDTASLKYHLEDHMLATLTTIGYTTGTLNDRLRAFYKSKTGSSNNNINDLAFLFYSTTVGRDFV